MADLQSREGRRLLGRDKATWCFEVINMDNPISYVGAGPKFLDGHADDVSRYRVITPHQVVQFAGEPTLRFDCITNWSNAIWEKHKEGGVCELSYMHVGDNGVRGPETETALILAKPATYAILDHRINVHVWDDLGTNKRFFLNFNKDGSVLFCKPAEPDSPNTKVFRPRFVDSFDDEGQGEAHPNDVVQKLWHEDSDIPPDVRPGHTYFFPDVGLALVLGLDTSTRILILALPPAPVMAGDDTVRYIDGNGYEVTQSRWPKHSEDEPRTLVHGHVSTVRVVDEESPFVTEWIWETQNQDRTFWWEPDNVEELDGRELDGRASRWVAEASRVVVHGDDHRVVRFNGKVTINGTKYEASQLVTREGELYDVDIGEGEASKSVPKKGVLLLMASGKDDDDMMTIFAILNQTVDLHFWSDGDGIEVYCNLNRNSLSFGALESEFGWCRPRFCRECFNHCPPHRILKQRKWADDAQTPIDQVQAGTTYVFPEGIQLIRAVERSRRNVIVEIPPCQFHKDAFLYWFTPDGSTMARTRRPVSPEEVQDLLNELGEEAVYVDAEGHVCKHFTGPRSVEGGEMPLVFGCVSRLRGEGRHFSIPSVDDVYYSGSESD